MARKLLHAPAFMRTHMGGNARRCTTTSVNWTIRQPDNFTMSVKVPAGFTAAMLSSDPAKVVIVSLGVGKWKLSAIGIGNVRITMTTTNGVLAYTQHLDMAVTP